MEVKNFKRVSPSAAFIKRVKSAKVDLPKDYKKIIYTNYPEYNTHEGSVLVQNVVACRTADVVLTEILEKIASGELKLKS